MKINKYDIIMICWLILFAALLFSGLSDSSIIFGILSVWTIVFSGLSGAKAHFIRNPDQLSKKKIIHIILIVAGILLSILLLLSVWFKLAFSPLAAKIIISVLNSLIILLGCFKLLFRRSGLSKSSMVSYFIAIFTLLIFIFFIWWLPFFKTSF